MADTKEINVYETIKSISFQVDTNTNVVNINKVIIEGGGGTGATNLGYTPSATNGIVTSDTGADATIPLADSTNAGLLTPAEKTKLQGIATGAEVNVNADWNAVSGDAQILNKPTIPSISGLATTTYVDTQDALKVDKVTGKGLSTEDYTSAEKTKLDGIAAGAEVNVNADWNATSGDAQILNKPTIPTATNQITNNGADGVNPFITALDIPTQNQASTLVREVKNMTGATLTKGTVVYISGANGSKALVSKALATTDALSSRTFGLLQSDISNNGLGNCVIIGDLSGLDTSTFAEGAQLYLSGVTAGTFTSSKILAPTHLVYVGKVTRVHPTQGQIEVGIQNGYELEEIHDCQIVTPTNDDFLQYESSTDLWKNKQLTDTLIKSKLGISVLSGSNTGDQDLSNLVVKNTTITGATKTKITYDSKGLVTNGQDASLNDLSDANISSPLADQVLVFDGLGEFRNGFLLSSSISNFNETTRAQVEAELIAGTNITITPSGTGATRQLTIASSAGGNPSQSAYTILANNTNSSATPTEQPFENLTNESYTSTIVWTGGSAPSGSTQHTYSLSQIGNLVTLIINLSYGTAGAATLTAVACELPNTAPTPALPTSVSAVGDVLNYGSGLISALKTANTVFNSVALRIKSTGVYEVAVTRTTGVGAKQAYITIQYFV
jgi:hypothetical protein